MIGLPLLLLAVISGPIMDWRSLPNRTVEIMPPHNKQGYHTIKEIGYCDSMKYVLPDEAILKADKQCYRISIESFEIKQ